MSDLAIRKARPDAPEALYDELAALLHACVHAGASVSFILPFPMAESRRFWLGKVRPAVQAGGRILLVAEERGRVIGSAQLDIDLPPNQAHRGEVAKLLTHPAYRRRGVARRLMTALEAEARGHGLGLITLDTRTCDNAEPLYRSLGYAVAGVIPSFAKAPDAERYDATTYMYKMLP